MSRQRFLIGACALVSFAGVGALEAAVASPNQGGRNSVYLATGGKELQQRPLDVGRDWSPSGWMGDGEAGEKFVKFTQNWRTQPRSGPTCIKVSYRPGPKSWAGIYWLRYPNNWERGADLTGYRRLTFWARGERGIEMVKFVVGTDKDSSSATTGVVALSKSWTQYTVDLSHADLRSIAGGFAWTAAKQDNPSETTFYLDDITFE